MRVMQLAHLRRLANATTIFADDRDSLVATVDSYYGPKRRVACSVSAGTKNSLI